MILGSALRFYNSSTGIIPISYPVKVAVNHNMQRIITVSLYMFTKFLNQACARMVS